MKGISALLLMLLLGAMLTAGCTAFEGSDYKSISTESLSKNKEYQSDEYAGAPMVEYAQENSVPEPFREARAEDTQVSEQKIIRTADIRIEVTNVTISAEKLQEIAKQYDGVIQSLSISAGSQNRYTGTITIRVPAESFDAVLIDVRSLGKTLSSSVKADDVTEEYVDLIAKQEALTNQLIQYNRLLTKGQNVSEILEVQKEIERVQVELDRIVGRMKYLDNRTSLSTITISLSEPAQVETPGGYSLPTVINDGIAGFIDTIIWLFIGILTLLPVILIGIFGFWAYKKWKQNRSE